LNPVRLPCVVGALRKHEELAMKTLIGAAIVAGSLALAGLGTIQPAAAAPKAGVQPIDAPKATDLSARRRHHYGYDRYHEPYYLARPTYYRPYPYYYRPYPYYAAAPFPFGVGFSPGIWPWGYW
jgi:hypothetical protein